MATVSASLNFSQEDSSETLSQFDSSNLSTELEVQLYQTVCSLRDTLKQSTDMSNGLLCKLKECYIRKCDLEEENDQLNKALHFINDKHELEIHERKVLAKNYDQKIISLLNEIAVLESENQVVTNDKERLMKKLDEVGSSARIQLRDIEMNTIKTEKVGNAISLDKSVSTEPLIKAEKSIQVDTIQNFAVLRNELEEDKNLLKRELHSKEMRINQLLGIIDDLNRSNKTLQQDLDETTRLLYEQHDYSSPNLFSETDFMDINGTGLRPCVSLETELSSSMPNPNEGLRRSRSSDSDLILNENIIHEEKTRAREMLLTSIKIKTFDSGINTPVNEFTEIEELIYFFVEQIGESDLVQINRKLKQPFDITKVSGISQGIVDDVRTKAELLKVVYEDCKLIRCISYLLVELCGTRRTLNIIAENYTDLMFHKSNKY
ncbi:hypothetical protein O9G_001299 [Rozella allomycis CSF55]|uniref:Uncharacterized protein n=1 Tax=Rozella allomycis (strain CSF55) TaxID=988480 RepID=A0A075AUJ8_ROZAC|nr:hypothetical protein O9G_001299 [Rozella allomycis CSF55]|eukprot:EPZ32397.1 hypothetical protein O9G_001299 [Rozella allomycis CSF55]